MVELFERERAYFESQKPMLLAAARDRFAVLKGERLLGIFESDPDAYDAGRTAFGNVPFLIRQITEDEPEIALPTLLLLHDR